MKKHITIYDVQPGAGFVYPSVILQVRSDIDSFGVYIVNGSQDDKPNAQFNLVDGHVEVDLWGQDGDDPQIKVRYDASSDKWLVV